MLSLRALIASLALALPLGLALPAAAPALAEPLDLAHYSGTWLEVGRTPMKLTDGCGAGTTTYTLTDATHVTVVDDCRQGGPDGKRKSITGKGVIRDPGSDHIMDVRYFLVVNWRFEVLDHDPDGRWFIAGDLKRKAGQRIFIFTREPPTEAELAELVKKARATGYAGTIETPRTR